MIGTLLLNRYELLEKIGEGGMGTVYKAKCHLLNRFVAVKILKVELSKDEDFIARFKREANSVARLSHPNIVNVFDVGEENHINFIVMEYINGKTLKKVIKENIRLSSEATLNIAFQIAKALECIHKNNIIHRDIKPDNILITDDNIVKVMDFGICKVIDSQTMTSANKIMGSVHYFSPEQAKGDFVDCRTDIYSLGVVMYEMVTGRVPFDAKNSVSVAMMHINQPVTSAREIITDIPENINQVILKALQKEPNNRYQTAKEMAGILNKIKQNHDFNVSLNTKITDDKTVAYKPLEIKRPINKINKNKKLMIIIGLIILVLIIGVLGKYLFKNYSTVTPTTVIPKSSVKLAVVEKKFVPSLIGSTEDNAKNIIVNNGFLVGNISNNYSDTVVKGLVINQLPGVNTSYQKNGKIDLFISRGKKIAENSVLQTKRRNDKSKKRGK